MKYKLILLGIVVLAFFSGLFIGKFAFTGMIVSESNDEYTWTKAICNDRQCIDVLITCKDDNVVDLKPLSDLIEVNLSNTKISNSLC